MSSYQINLGVKPQVTAYFEIDSSTFSYLVKEPDGNACAVIDPVLDFDYAAGRTSTRTVDNIKNEILQQGLTLEWLIETHVHADHLSAAPYLRESLGGRIGIGRNIDQVQHVFAEIFNEGADFQRDGSQFDYLFDDDERYQIGSMPALAMMTPGHTPACMTHIIGDSGFVGDTLFMPDGGTARADFPGGDAGLLYDSMQKILSLPDQVRLFVCHDYAPGGRKHMWETSVAAEREHNIHLSGVSRDEFIKLRQDRDSTLSMPRLILPSVQVNMRAGNLPRDKDDREFLKIPLNSI